MSEAYHLILGQKGKKIILIVGFLSICVLYLVTKFDSQRNYVAYDDQYLSKYLLPKDFGKVANVEEGEASGRSWSHSFTERNYHSEIKRNVFIEMQDINKSTENIFFIESRCSTEKMAVYFKGNRGLVLNARQCCAIESTAQMNLDHKVYLFHSCSLDNDFFQHSSKFVVKLFKYPNIYVVRFNTSEIFTNTPLEDLHRKKLLERSNYPVEHTSDLIRLALLWKYGGTYSDLDVVTIRSFNNLKTNWAGMQDLETIANGVLNFEPKGEGHQMLQKALEYANTHYDPSNWSSNGPLLLTPLILQECKVKQVPEAQKNCSGSFTVLNNTVLYPIYYKGAGDFFDHNLGENIVSNVKTGSYSVHIWNAMSHHMVVTVGSTQAYALLADEYCPQVYKNCGPLF